MSVARAVALMAIAITCAVNAQTVKLPIKTPIKGLVSMGAYRFVADGGQPDNTLWPLYRVPKIFGGIVIVATWAELQPSKGADLPQHNPIDRALEAVREYNGLNGDAPLAVKLRVWGGFEAPPWAMTLDGEQPVTVTFRNKPRTLGHPWRAEYRKAWRDFQARLAARYDNEPLIHEVAVTSCMTFTAEPFFIPDDPAVVQPLLAAHFTNADYRACLQGAVGDYNGWQATRIEFPFNPFAEMDSSGHTTPRLGFTLDVIHECRVSLGERCTLDNHDLNVPPLKSIEGLYERMRALGGPIEFQTFYETPDFYEGTIAYGVGLGAGSIELWQDYKGFPDVPAGTLKQWASFFNTATVKSP